MSVQPIISVLEKLEKMHKSLFELAIQKTEIVKKGDMDELNTMLKNEQSHIAAIEQLEQQRQQLVMDYLDAKGIVFADTPTVLDVIEAAELEQEREQLTSVRERLISVIDDLRQQNDLNQKLVFQSLQFVHMTLDMMRPNQEQMNYSGKVANTNNVVSKKSLFDSQA